MLLFVALVAARYKGVSVITNDHSQFTGFGHVYDYVRSICHRAMCEPQVCLLKEVNLGYTTWRAKYSDMAGTESFKIGIRTSFAVLAEASVKRPLAPQTHKASQLLLRPLVPANQSVNTNDKSQRTWFGHVYKYLGQFGQRARCELKVCNEGCCHI
jgi:hypothetical protein